MKLYRRIVVLLFIITCAVFVYYQLNVVRTKDNDAPEITMDTDTIQVSVEATNEDLLAGITAADARDGDVSNSLMVESKTKFFSPGKYEITVDAFDTTGNVAKATRTVEYTDYTPPVLHLKQPLRFANGDQDTELQEMFTATDVIDGDISGKIKYALAENFNSRVSGEYIMAVQVSNSFGDTVKQELTATVLDEEDYELAFPEFSEYMLFTKVGQEVDPLENLIGVQQKNSEYLFDDSYMTQYEPSQVQLSDSTVDYSKPGVYRMTYTLHKTVKKSSLNEEELMNKTTVYDEATGEELGVDMTQGSVDVFVIVEE